MPKLKDHLLPRIKRMLLDERSAKNVDTPHFQVGLTPTNLEPNRQERDSIFFKNDRIYRHQLARFNYTTYDVRRAQDVINPTTSHCDILLLANKNGENSAERAHHFLYARVLGIYHANVVFTGEGMLDYQARRVDFLWVRWFEYEGSRSVGWKDIKLDSVRFPPMQTGGAFGFIDPRDVLRGCHIIPAFARGKSQWDGISISRCARDGNDWASYYINRCVKAKFL
jgi:hypothetical protein